MKLTLRDLFWATFVVGLVIGWWLDRRNFRYSEQVLLHMVTEARMEAEDAKWKLQNR